MIDKRDMPLAMICILALGWWMMAYGCKPPPQPPPDGAAPAAAESSHTATEDAYLPQQSDSPAPQGAEASTTAQPQKPVPEPEPTAAGQPTAHDAFTALKAAPLVTLTDTEFDVEIDPESGGVIDALLRNYQNETLDGVMQLGEPSFPMLAISPRDSRESWAFTHAKTKEGAGSVSFERGIQGRPLVLEQGIALDPEHRYGLTYTVRLRNVGQEPLESGDLKLNCGVMQPLDTARGFMGAGGMDQRVDIRRVGKKKPKWWIIDKIPGMKERKVEEIAGTPADWIAVQNKYFASVVTPQVPFTGAMLDTADGPNEGAGQLILGYGFLESESIAPGDYAEWTFSVHLGPKLFDQLKLLGNGQDRIMQLDLFMLWNFKWMEGISLIVFKLLKWLEGWLPGWGWAIMALTLMIRTLFWPITHRATMLSRRMQALAPEMKELREKFKDDPQRMQEKTFELYKKHKVNPLTGCLPMVLQIPVFFALFNVLRNAIELRQEGWLWAFDLSKPDTLIDIAGFPLNPLAITMGLTMFLQQHLTPTSADPNQKRIMQFMTIGFMVMLYSMPSGLTLYWTVNNLVSILQYRLTRTKAEGESEPANAT